MPGELRVGAGVTRLRLTVDAETTVLLPAEDLSGADRERWAVEGVQEMARAQEWSVERAQRTAVLIASAQQRAAGDAGQHLMIYDAATQAWAWLQIVVVDAEPSPEQLRELLEPEGLLPPRRRLAETEALGTGCSCAVLVSAAQAQCRWVFVSAGWALWAILRSAPGAFGPALARAESIVDTLAVDGREPSPSASFDPVALVAPPHSEDRAWQI